MGAVTQAYVVVTTAEVSRTCESALLAGDDALDPGVAKRDQMAAVEFLPAGVSRRNLTAWIQRDAYPTVVWLQGKDDTSNVAALCETLAEAVSLTDADHLVLDLSGVESMSTATLIVILKTGDLLRQHSRSLVLRSPSEAAQRLCALAESNDYDLV